MKFGSLFSGIGGLDLGLERAGMECVWQSEVNEYCNLVLAKHWPNVPNLGDITAIDWNTVERPDLICGGYPCQPFSLAGKRQGASDDRHLWPYFADALRVLRPEWALLENVPGHLSLGFGEVHADLASLGYDTEWELLPAAAFGAPHVRFRLVLVAHANGDGLRNAKVSVFDRATPSIAWDDGAPEDVADAASSGLEGRPRPKAARSSFGESPDSGEPNGWWDAEPNVGRVADGVPNRVDRLRSLGNAVVPQMAEWVGKQIMATQLTTLSDESILVS